MRQDKDKDKDKDKEERRREENGTGEKRNLASLLVVYKVRFCLWQLVHGAIGFAEDLRKLLQLWNQLLMLCDCKSIISHPLPPHPPPLKLAAAPTSFVMLLTHQASHKTWVAVVYCLPLVGCMELAFSATWEYIC